MRLSAHDHLTPGQVLDREFLEETKLLEGLGEDSFLVRWRDQELIVARVGRCEYLSCKAMCCSMLCLKGPWTSYIAGFADQGRASPLVRIPCRFLQADLTCLRWNLSDFPENCRSFPAPGDPMYLEVMEQCSFAFELVRRTTHSEDLTS
jgi:hypothetical protein